MDATTDVDTPVVDPEWQDLTPHERDLLVTLYQHGPATAGDLNDLLGETCHLAHTQKVLGELRAKGFIRDEYTNERPRSPCGRRFLTDAGKHVVEKGLLDTARRIDAVSDC